MVSDCSFLEYIHIGLVYNKSVFIHAQTVGQSFKLGLAFITVGISC